MKISEKVHALKIPFLIHVTPEKSINSFVNVFLITGKKIYLIDAGVKGSYNTIFNYLSKIGRNKNEI